MAEQIIKKLPVGNPLAFGYQFFAYPLAIQATDVRTTDWVLSNFIQVEYDRRGQECDVPFSFYLYDYALSPWLETVRGTRLWYSTQDMTDVVRAALARGYYAYLIVDEFHIPMRQRFAVERFPHDILVHGVDDASGTFDVLGYDQRMQFRSTRVTQAQFRAAHRSLDDQGVEHSPVVFYRLRDKPDFGYPPIRYDFNLGLVRRTIDEYLRSIDTSRHFESLREPRDCAYGVESYGPLETFLRQYAAGRAAYDVRHVHVLWEHKKLMSLRVRRIADLVGPLDDLTAEVDRAEAYAEGLRNSMIRNHLQGGRAGFLDSALRTLENLRTEEERTLCRLLQRLPDEDVLLPLTPVP
ncbi:hypothetical protein ACIBJE_21475 [Micromonospora sp. NPDC050187]|uniref:hypothetical protein n=1 Tax=Micromonospora sp. NPDC050187 TaxID=3364277 RepID=UPI0037A14D9E